MDPLALQAEVHARALRASQVREERREPGRGWLSLFIKRNPSQVYTPHKQRGTARIFLKSNIYTQQQATATASNRRNSRPMLFGFLFLLSIMPRKERGSPIATKHPAPFSNDLRMRDREECPWMSWVWRRGAKMGTRRRRRRRRSLPSK